MDFTILGSGGAITTPRPFCQCAVCSQARINPKKVRNSSSIFLKEINAVVDCGEDIANSLNRENIGRVDYLFITHWHPDHTFGLRTVVEAYFNFREKKNGATVQVYMPKKVFDQLKEHWDCFDYLQNVIKVLKINFIEDGESKEFGNIKVTAIGFNGKDSETFGYLFEEAGKKVLYTPCDTISFKREDEFKDLDLLINECGLFSKIGGEIQFFDLIKRIKNMGPKKAILTHIEEIELNVFGEEYLEKLKEKYSDVNFCFAFDGMKIKV